MKYLKKFNTEEEYNTFLDSEEYVDPNVSLVGSIILKYNPIRMPMYIEALEDLTVKKSGSGVFYYSTDLFNWTDLGTTSVSVQKGNKIYFKSTSLGSSVVGIGKFIISGRCNVGGNIMSMYYGDEYKKGEKTVRTNQFAGLFSECTTIINAKDLVLPATNLQGGCYYRMFNGCTSLVTAPKLPALYIPTYLSGSNLYGAYGYMFENCTSLIEAPELPAETIESQAYAHMFTGCTNLKKASKINVKTFATGPTSNIVKNGGYHMSDMFKNCINLIDVPEVLLPTSLMDRCYSSMFEGCTSLKIAPKIVATSLASYCCNRMFYNCTNLETVPELSATSLIFYCYYEMFMNCTSLKYVKALFKTISTSYTQDWMKNVGANGTFVKHLDATWTTTGNSAVPSSWTIRYYDPNTDKTVIKFKIGGTSYIAEENATWADWVASSYNTAGFTISGTNVLSADGATVTLSNTAVVSTDAIKSNASYAI